MNPTPCKSPGIAPKIGRFACVIVPMYNEARVLAPVLGEVLSRFESVICVDDGSQDSSAEIAAQHGALVVRHPLNMGQGAAIRSGIEVALNDLQVQYVITLDADGQHSTEDAVRMLSVCEEEGIDVVLGSRFLAASDNIPKVRRAVLQLAARFTRFTTGLDLTDAHNGLRVMNRRAAEAMRPNQPGMAHASEMLSAVALHGLAWREEPVNIVYTEYSMTKGQSNLNVVNILHDLLIAKLRATP